MTRLATTVLAALLAGGSVAALSVAEPKATAIAGNADVVDGDTILVGTTRVRLFGIDAPEALQTCTGAPASKTSDDCGLKAALFLVDMIDRDPMVSCRVKATDRYGRTVAVCGTSKFTDLGAMMVLHGWAVDVPRYSGGAYHDQEAAAKAERLGIWSGTFVPPSEWRKAHRN